MAIEESHSTDHPDNSKLVHEGWKDLKEKRRWPTDFLCLLLLIAAWVAMTFVGLVATGIIQDNHLKHGNLYRVLYQMDYNGDICGFSSIVKNKKYGYFLPDGTAVCLSKCPTTTDFSKFECRYNIDSANLTASEGYYNLALKKCMYQIKSTSVLYRCIPDESISVLANGATAYAESQGIDTGGVSYSYVTSTGANWISKFLGDIYDLRAQIFSFGLAVTVVVSFCYLYLLRLPGFLFIVLWGVIIGIFVLLIIGSFLLWALANTWNSDNKHSTAEVLAMRVFAYFGMGVTALYFCLIIVLRKRVNLAIGIIKQAARALTNMPSLLALPVIQAIGLACFLVPWVIYLLYLASSGDMETITVNYTYQGQNVSYSYKHFTYTTNTQWAFLYMLFMWYWTSEFLIAVGQLIIALAFSGWYFTRDKSASKGYVFWAFRTTMLYHLGTAAFGSLIIAIIKTIRTILAYLQRKAKKSHNKILQYILCIIQCIMWCLEKILKFINKNAYIITAIYGYSFMRSARKAFFLLLRNILRVAAVNMVSGFLLLVGKLFIPLATTFFFYICIAYGSNNNDIAGIIGPLVFTFFLSYWVASMFIEIFGMGIETILLCFIADEEMFKPEDRFAEADLMTTIQRTAQAAAANKIGPDIPQAQPVNEVLPQDLHKSTKEKAEVEVF